MEAREGALDVSSESLGTRLAADVEQGRWMSWAAEDIFVGEIREGHDPRVAGVAVDMVPELGGEVAEQNKR